MTPELLTQKDGPAKKFYLIKVHGEMLRAAGYDPKVMSCKEIEAAIADREEER